MKKDEVESARGARYLGSAFFIHHSEVGAGGETRTPVGRIARQFTKLLLSLLSHAGFEEVDG
jgi:hypothetical protein